MVGLLLRCSKAEEFVACPLDLFNSLQPERQWNNWDLQNLKFEAKLCDANSRCPRFRLQSLPKQPEKKLTKYHTKTIQNISLETSSHAFFRAPCPPPWTMLVRKYDYQTWRKAIQLLDGCALTHFVIAHKPTSYGGGGGGEKRKNMRFFQEFWQRL